MSQVALLSEPIIMQSFFDELQKNAGFTDVISDAFKTFKIKGTDSYKLLRNAAKDAGERELAEASKAKAEKVIEEKTKNLHGVHDTLTRPSPKEQEASLAAARKKQNRNFALGFGLLGAGALGYGYNQYKKVTDDQVTGVNYRPEYQ